MSEKIEFKAIWRAASLGGIVLAAVSIAYMLFNYKVSGSEAPSALTILSFVLDLVKIVACIWLMRYFMWRFKQDFPEASKQDVRRVGTWIALLSAIIFAAANMMYFTINPEMIEETFNTILSSAKDALDHNAIASLDALKLNFPKYIFISQLIYCFLFGWVLSSILAPRIVPDNPFAEDDFPGKKEQQEAEEDEDDDIFKD